MPIPWLRVVDAAFGLGDLVWRVGTQKRDEERPRALARHSVGSLEARLAGVVVGALKEAFDRDHRRHELERQQIEEQRERAERALRLELQRQVGEREIGRMRLVGGIALAAWLGTLAMASRLLEGAGGRVALGLGWLLLLAALGFTFSEQARISQALASADDRMPLGTIGGRAGATVAPWLVIVGLIVIAFGTLLS
jgi:hypothetical protein